MVVMKRRLPPLTALRAFEAAARLGSFRDAADELAVSQSAISHQIKHLEANLGVELFVRTARAVELSDAGKAYHPVIRDAFDRIDTATRQLLSPEAENVLTIQMYSTFAVRWLMPRLQAFQTVHPQLQVRLNTSQIDADFTERGIDLAVMIGQRKRDTLYYDYLFSPRMMVVCSPKYLETAKENGLPLAHPEDLASHPILQVYPSANDWAVWLEANGVTGVDPDAGLRFDSYDHALKTAARGLGVALAMQPYVAEDFEAGHLVDVFPQQHVRTIGHWFLTCPRERPGQRKVRLFADWLKAEIASDPHLTPLVDRAMLGPAGT